jgi:HAMP domain-containing protein
MDPTTQLIVDIVLGVAGALCLFILTAVWNRLGKLETTDATISAKMAELHILVAGEYIKRSEVADSLEKIYQEIKGLRDVMSNGAEKRHQI